MARCACGSASCSCVIKAEPGGGATVTGSGSALRPYLIGLEDAGNQLANLDAVDTPSLNLTLTGAGTPSDRMRISGVATPKLTELRDTLVGDIPASGDVPTWNGTAWEFKPPAGGGGGTGLPAGGTDGQVLTKQSATDGDALWETLPDDGDGGGVVEPVIASSRAHATATSIPNNAWTSIPFDTSIYEDGIAWEAANNLFRIPVDGYYHIDGGATFAVNATASRAVAIYHNSGRVAAHNSNNLTPNTPGLPVSTTIKAVAGDYITLRLWQNSGAALAMVASTSNNWLTVTKVGSYSGSGDGRVYSSSRRHGGATSLPHNTSTNVPFDTEDYTDGITWNGTAYVVPVAGYYNVNANVAFTAHATGMRTLRLLVNGTGAVAGSAGFAPVGSETTAATVSRTLKLAAGDLVSVSAQQSSGTTLTVVSNVGWNFFNITKVPTPGDSQHVIYDLRPASALMDTYPLGTSTLNTGTSPETATAGWPTGFAGTVLTVRSTSGPATGYQVFSRNNGTSVIDSQFRQASVDGWSAWTGLAGTSQPHAMAAGIAVMPSQPAAATGVGLVVTLPTGRFSVNPIVSAAAASTGYGAATVAVTSATSFTARYYNPTSSSAQTGSAVHWTAVQMSPTAAAG